MDGVKDARREFIGLAEGHQRIGQLLEPGFAKAHMLAAEHDLGGLALAPVIELGLERGAVRAPVGKELEHFNATRWRLHRLSRIDGAEVAAGDRLALRKGHARRYTGTACGKRLNTESAGRVHGFSCRISAVAPPTIQCRFLQAGPAPGSDRQD